MDDGNTTSGYTKRVVGGLADTGNVRAIKPCVICYKRNIISPVTNFCLKCGLQLCRDCYQQHEIVWGAEDNHETLSLRGEVDNDRRNHGDIRLEGKGEEDTSNHGDVEGRKPIDLKGIDRCERHNRVFVYYCDNHEALCCEDCHFHDHKACNDVHKVTDRADDNDVVDTLLVARLVNTISLAQGIVEYCEKKCKGFKQEKEELLKHFDRRRIEINNLLDEARGRLEQAIDDNLSADEDRLHNIRFDAVTVSLNIEQVLQLSEQVNKHGSGVEKLMLNIVGNSRSKPAARNFTRMYENEYSMDRRLKWNDNVIEMLQTHRPLVSFHAEPIKPVTLELLKTGRLLSKTWRDKLSPWISGLDFLPDGRVVCADNYNRKIFVLNGELQRVGSAHTFDANTNPRDVSCCNLEMIAVTLNTKTIALLSVSESSKISPLKTLTTTLDCFSIANLDYKTFLIGTVEHPRPVCSVDSRGQVEDIKRLALPEKSFCLGNSAIAYIPFTKTVLLTDSTENSLLICDIASGECKTVKDDRISSPKGVCGSPNGTMFVCSSARDSIVQISLHGEVVTSHRLELANPSAMAISSDGIHLVVCNHGEGQDTIIQLFKII